MRVLAFVALFLSCSSFAATFAPDQVRIVRAVDQTKCKFIKQNTCQSRRKNGLARCEQWHKIMAGRAGANQIEIITESSEKRPVMLNGTLLTKSATHITADYYFCEEPQAPTADEQAR